MTGTEKPNSWLKAVRQPNVVVKCKTFNVPSAVGAQSITVQMKSHIRLNSLSLDSTILPVLIRTSKTTSPKFGVENGKTHTNQKKSPFVQEQVETSPRSALTLWAGTLASKLNLNFSFASVASEKTSSNRSRAGACHAPVFKPVCPGCSFKLAFVG